MKNSVRILAALFVISFMGFGVVQGFGQEMSAEQKEVWKMEEAYWEFFKQGDLKGHMALWHKDAQMWSFRGLAPITKGANETYFNDGKFKINSYKLGWPTINIFGNVAIIFYRVTHEGFEDFPPLSMRVIHTWMKQDGKWQLIGGMAAESQHKP